MRMVLFGLAAAVPLALTAIPAQAQDSQVASAEIARGAWIDAEKALVKELRIHPGRPELLLNLAAVYSNTGRDAEARALYQQVLTQREVLMDLAPERTAGSHAIARTGLRRIGTVQLSAR
jgi:tetratricopeptide (TPR) repeat protein